MYRREHARIWGRLGVRGALIVGIAGSACSLSVPALAGPAGPARAAPGTSGTGGLSTGPVSPVPVDGTPTLASTGTEEQVRQLVQCGNTMYAVGTFTAIKQGSTTYARANAFSFSAVAPYKITPWAPAVNGTVDTIAFSGGNCADAYIGGQFSAVGAVPAKNIAELDTTTGALVPGFQATASAEVDTLLAVNGHLLAGGEFKGIGGGKADPYLASLSPVTGKDDGFVHLAISGNYVYPGVATNPTKVYNQQLSHGGTLDLVEGDFTSVGGLPRQQVFMLNLAGPAATVTGWSSPEFDGSRGNLPGGYPYQCSDKEAFYIRAAAWAPDDSAVYTAATGFEPWNWSVNSPRTGLCDSVAAFPATQSEVTHEWINYTGCDSLYSIATDTSAVYMAGHERWASNSFGCNHPGPGSLPAPGLGGLTPSGALLTNSGNTAGLYSRSRGRGADDLLVTSDGLWIASDNFGGNTSCGGVPGHSGICFLPYSQTR